MKKLFYSIAAFSPLAFATKAFAEQSVDPCVNPTNETLKNVCAAQGQEIGAIVGFVITVAFIIAVLIALLFLIWGGIKWITSGGDKAGVETARNQIIAAVIGLIIVFLAFFILNLVLGLFGLSLFDLKLPTLPGVAA